MPKEQKFQKSSKMLEIEAEWTNPIDEILEQLYIKEQRGSPEIGKMLGVSKKTILDWLKASGIRTRNNQESHSTPDYLKKMQALTKQRWQDPEWKAATIEKISQGVIRWIEDNPQMREEFSKRLQATWENNLSMRQFHQDRWRELWQNEEFRAEKIQALQEKWQNPNYRTEKVQRMKQRMAQEKKVEEEYLASRQGENYPILTPEQERMFAIRKSRGYKQAREILICSHLRLVGSIASQYQGYGIEFSDLFQVGAVGLIQAVDRFDHRRGARLATYARYYISGGILKFLDKKIKEDQFIQALCQNIKSSPD